MHLRKLKIDRFDRSIRNCYYRYLVSDNGSGLFLFFSELVELLSRRICLNNAREEYVVSNSRELFPEAKRWNWNRFPAILMAYVLMTFKFQQRSDRSAQKMGHASNPEHVINIEWQANDPTSFHQSWLVEILLKGFNRGTSRFLWTNACP